MKTLLAAFATFGWLISSTSAVTVVFDNDDFSLEKETKWIASHAAIADSALVAEVERLLGENGYLDAAVELRSDTLRIRSGELSYLGGVRFEGDSVWHIDGTGAFTSKNLRAVVDEALRGFEARGYLYAAANVTSFERENGRVSVNCRFARGPLVRLGALQLFGLVRSRSDAVRRFLSAAAGDTLTLALIGRLERQAKAIPYLISLGRPVVRPREGYTQADLELNFAEKRQVRIEGGGGYDSGDEGGLVWSLDMAFANLLGGGREASVRSERRDKDRQTLDIGYCQPVFLLGPGSAEVEVSTRDYRDDFYEFGLAGAYTVQVASDFSVGVNTGWKSVEPVANEPSYSRFSGGFRATRSTLDIPANPASGFSMIWSLEYVRRAYGDRVDSTETNERVLHETRADLAIDLYQRLVGRAVVHVGLGYQGLETAEALPPLSELILVGGPGTIRGYRNEQFAAVRTALITFEPRLRFERASLFVFYDAAYLNNRIVSGRNVETDEIYRFGYGLGMRLIDRGRMVTVSLGWNSDLSLNAPRLSLEFSSSL